MLFMVTGKLITNIWKVMIRKESSYRNYWDVNDLYGCAVSQELPVDGF